jgi:hypothetical protein
LQVRKKLSGREQKGDSAPGKERLCADLRIPRPTGGYWCRLQHGGASEQIPLPSLPEGTQTDIPLGRRLDEQPPPEPPTYLGKSEEKASTTIKQRRQVKTKENDDATDAAEVPPASPTTAPGQSRADAPKATAPAREAQKFREVVNMTREELYRHVWTTPMHILSGALGLSDIGLAKTCKQMEGGQRLKRSGIGRGAFSRCAPREEKRFSIVMRYTLRYPMVGFAISASVAVFI